MSYTKRFLNKSGTSSPISGMNTGSSNSSSASSSNTEFGYKNYMSRLPEVYTGHPNRVERYNQYEMMDVDAEINACLDIISEFSTQKNKHNKTPFSFEFKEEPTPHEVELLSKQLYQWCKLNEFETRIFKIFRNILKYGDQVFVRDPDNFKLYWVDMIKVTKVIVNESEGKKPEQYVLKDININLQNLTVAQKTNTDFAANPSTGMGGTGAGATNSYTVPNMSDNTSGSRFTLGQTESAIDAKHIVHLSLTEGLDRFWPFGQSILENVFKVYKQKELLEDAILIYRVQRAPERRLFKIDVGNMPSHMAMAFVERVKNEIHQRRIPSVSGGQSVVDASYNPLCLDLDTIIPLLDGRKLKLSEIISEFEQGKENWAYSCDPVTGKVVPGVINWAGVTRKNTEVIEITFDNEKTLVCTPDHSLVTRDAGFKKAESLKVGDALMPFNTKNDIIKNNYDKDYTQVYDNFTKKWVSTHRMVAEFMKDKNEHEELVYLNEHKNDNKCTNYDGFGDQKFIESLEVYNHRITKIECVENRDTGTITIDGLHRWHDYHTFAIDSGIFVKNSTNEDYFFPVTADGRGSSIEVLPGGQNLGEIDDLKYFNNRLARGLRVPSSYLPTGPDDNSTPLSDGRVGTAMIQEFRFNQYCERLQNYVCKKLDEEFKLFLRWRGFNLDTGLFSITFNPPQNFAAYRQSELDTARVSTFTQMETMPYISKRFALARFLGLTEEEIAKNEKMWHEENKEKVETGPEGADLRNIGVSTGDFDADFNTADDIASAEEADGGDDIADVAGPVADAGPSTPPEA